MSAAVAEAPVEVTEPGTYTLPEDTYRADPVPARVGGSLSVSGAKLLLPPSCPALFKWDRDHGQVHRDAFDFGHAAHAKVLGVGAEVVAVDAADWRTKAAQQAKIEAHATGKVPLLAADVEVVDGMAAALAAHPIASVLFDPDHGQPEQSLFWQDDQAAGVWRRGRLDWLPEPTDGRMIVADYKTAASAAPEKFAKALADYGYAMQAAWYLDGLRALGLADDDAAFLFVVQEKTAPYLVSVYQPDAEAIQLGRERNRRAIDIYAQCVSDDTWPGYAADVQPVSLPAWFVRAHYAQES